LIFDVPQPGDVVSVRRFEAGRSLSPNMMWLKQVEEVELLRTNKDYRKKQVFIDRRSEDF
jgi:hypothetical protein